MASICRLPESDLAEALDLHNQYTAQDRRLTEFRSQFQQTPSLFLGAYDEADLVGICLGWPTDPTTAELVGMGVAPDRRDRGIGSRLLERFETEAAALGITKVTLGSAGGDVDRFYMSQGYSPSSILVRVTSETLPSDFEDLGYDIAEERHLEDGSVKLYIPVENYEASDLTRIRERFGDDEAIYIMEKTISEG